MAHQTGPAPLIVFSDDWGRHPSSCQHLIRELLPTRPVTWVNTIGTRPPRLDRSTINRVAGKIRQWTKPKPAETSYEPAAGPVVLSPKMWPSFAGRFGRGVNRRLLTRALRPVVATLPRPPVILTTIPLVADLVDTLPPCRWVYYCVDDFSVWPGYDGDTLLRFEQQLVPKMNLCVAAGEVLQARVKSLGGTAELLTHGVDLGPWRATPNAEAFADLEPPIVLFWGVIDRRTDAAVVREISSRLAAGTIVFVGPREDPDPALETIPRVVLRPPVPFAALPGLAAAASVLVMPYTDAPVTQAMQPLKLKEYLATGRPCVVRDLPATRDWADCLDIANSPDAFATAVVERIASGVPAEHSRNRERLAAESWAAKAARLAAWIDAD